ncbi:MAG: sugar phosphate isomerase/epimerase family protein [Dehalococcoidia bacterium]
MFEVSACAWCLGGEPSAAVARLKYSGFDYVDLRPDCWDGIPDAGSLAGMGVRLACAGITPMRMAPGISLSSLATEDAGRALPYLAGAIQRASKLGARRAYMVTPPERVGGRPEYVQSLRRLADEAGEVGVGLCVEPHPGRALSDYTEVMRLLDGAGSDNLYALLDLGHLLITGEDPAATVRMLGDRIGYVHIDDNDGKADRHFGLLEGVLKPHVVDSFLDALAAVGYDRPVSIELSRSLPSPVASLVASRDYITRWGERRG